MKIIKPLTIIFLLIICLVNFYLAVFQPSPLLSSELKMSSLSAGDRYYGRLSLWYLLAKNGDWTNAVGLESQLDYADISAYKTTHDPAELKKYVNNLMVKPNKSVEDWLELSRIQSILGKTDSAGKSLLRAKTLDPVRDDISQIYYQLFR
jgi:hypothetical protein